MFFDRQSPATFLVTLLRVLVLISIFLPLTLGQNLGTGSTCKADTECASRWCQAVAVTPGLSQCASRPAAMGASCVKEMESTDCQTGYCSPVGKCDNAPTDDKNKDPGAACLVDTECKSSICANGPSGTKICLEKNLAENDLCSIDRQCGAGLYCPTISYQCRPLCQADGSCPREVNSDCSSDAQCKSGICDDHIANDGNKKVCLAGPGLAIGSSCDVDRQCGSSYCVPSTGSGIAGQTPLTCQEKKSGTGSTSDTTSGTGTTSGGGTGTTGGDGTSGGGSGTGSGGSGSGSGGGGSGSSGSGSGSGGSGSGGGGTVVTVTSISAGQTIQVVSTRTVSASASAATSSRSAAGPVHPMAGVKELGWTVVLLGITLCGRPGL